MSFNDQVKKVKGQRAQTTSTTSNKKKNISFGKGIVSQFQLSLGRPVDESADNDFDINND